MPYTGVSTVGESTDESLIDRQLTTRSKLHTLPSFLSPPIYISLGLGKRRLSVPRSAPIGQLDGFRVRGGIDPVSVEDGREVGGGVMTADELVETRLERMPKRERERESINRGLAH
jgi:hypothetical protein